MLDAELAEIVDNLRAIGADIADVEMKKAHGGIPRPLHLSWPPISRIHRSDR